MRRDFLYFGNEEERLKLRAYEPADCAEMARLFYETVHSVNAADYAPEQLDAWATGEVDLAEWNRAFSARHTLVAVEDGRIVGFGDMTPSGYLDRLYVHRDFQRRGAAAALCDALEARVRGKKITVHASITARPFFEKRGYRLVRSQTVERRGVQMQNFHMEKDN